MRLWTFPAVALIVSLASPGGGLAHQFDRIPAVYPKIVGQILETCRDEEEGSAVFACELVLDRVIFEVPEIMVPQLCPSRAACLREGDSETRDACFAEAVECRLRALGLDK